MRRRGREPPESPGDSSARGVGPDVAGGRPLGSHALVVAQMVAIAACLAPFPGSPRGSDYLLMLCVAGGAVGLWTLWHNRPGNFNVYPEPKPEGRLVTTGPYMFVRHPMYVALLLITTGFASYNGTLGNVVGLVLLIVVVNAKARREERALTTRYPAYEAYAKRTKRFVPYCY